MKKLLSFFILIFFMINFISAKSSPEYIDYLTNMIYEDCERYDLELNNNEPLINYNNEPLNKVQWPYQKDFLKKIIEILDSNDYAIVKDGLIYGKTIGYSLIWCTSNKSGRWGIVGTLDNDGTDYFWNGERIIMPKNEFKITYGDYSPIIEGIENTKIIVGEANSIIETQGDSSSITTGNNSPVNQTSIWFQFFWSKGTIGGLIIAGLITLIFKIIYLKYKKKSDELVAKVKKGSINLQIKKK